MKKLLFTLAASMLIISTSCDDINEKKQPSNSFQTSGQLPTCIIPVNAKQDSQVTLSEEPVYTYTVGTMSGLWDFSVSNLRVAGLQELRFTSPQMSDSPAYNKIFYYGGNFASNDGREIQNFIATYIQDYNYYTGESTVTGVKPLGAALMTMAFTVKDEYTIRAFPKTCYYAGSLVTKYKTSDGSEKEFTTLTPQIGVKVNMSSRTADISIHNVKFAEEMPVTLSIITLSGLPLTGDIENGYKIEAKNIIPVVGLGADATSYPDFTFDEIEMHPTNTQMTMCEINFKTASKYEGVFLGSIAR
ncbi:MAG: hypothetical protein NC402_01665 [Prevotella sp.]|nr:hypothetical protein [Prevotella sp.]MCM1075360.1 hypothetical protein [Ruminococcus sp.]